MCLKNNILITEELAEEMVKAANRTDSSGKLRQHLAEQIGDYCVEQGQYHLACKNYTQVHWFYCKIIVYFYRIDSNVVNNVN